MSPKRQLHIDAERARMQARKLAYKAKREVKKEATDFIRFWWVELLVICVFNIHMGHVVEKVAGVWPW